MQIPSPQQIEKAIPLSPAQKNFIQKSRSEIEAIVQGRDSRLLLIVGPCSIHSISEALAYAKKLKRLSLQMQEHCLIVMRTYIEKPRTRLGWKGLIRDPHLDGSCDLETGIYRSRKLLRELCDLSLPVATEILSPSLLPYIVDLVGWGCIGARTSSSPTHRDAASICPMPVGFKNGVDGDFAPAIDALVVAGEENFVPMMGNDGTLRQEKSCGNPNCHLVLRGGSSGPNYEANTLAQAQKELMYHNLNSRILIDCSHGNSGGFYAKQIEVFESVFDQVQMGNQHILGMMLESQLESGNQPLDESLKEGVSVTDSCLDFESTKELIGSLVPSPISISLNQS